MAAKKPKKEPVSGETPTPDGGRVEALRQLFPEAFAEGKLDLRPRALRFGRRATVREGLGSSQRRAHVVKLPKWFTVQTPVGLYEPDWAVVLDPPDGEGKPVLYFIAETKESPHLGELRNNARRKIECAAAHFGSKQFKKQGSLEGVDYKVVATAAELP